MMYKDPRESERKTDDARQKGEDQSASDDQRKPARSSDDDWTYRYSDWASI